MEVIAALSRSFTEVFGSSAPGYLSLLTDPVLLGILVVGMVALYLFMRAFVRRGFAFGATLGVVLVAAVGYSLVVAPLADRFEAARGGTLVTVPFPEITRDVFLLPTLRERSRSPRTDIAHVLTDQPITLRYGVTAAVDHIRADALVLVNWQVRSVAAEHNPTLAVRQQLEQTEAAIIRRIEAARAVSRPILVIGTTVAGVSEAPETALLRPRHPLGLQLTPAIRRALADYSDVRYVLTPTTDPQSGNGENRQARRAIQEFLSARSIETVRIVGASEQIVLRHVAPGFIIDPEGGRTHTVLVSPAELADTDSVLVPELEPDVVYRSLPVYALSGALRFGEREVFLATQSAGSVTQLGSLTSSEALSHF